MSLTTDQLERPDLVRAPAPGIYHDVPFHEYLGWDVPDQTRLKRCASSPAHYDAAQFKTPTDDMTLGSALHVAFLEPELMVEKVAKWTGARRAGKEWEAFLADNDGRYILTAGLHEKLVGMVRSLRRHPFVREWQRRIEAVEVSAVGAAWGFPMKGRVDAQTPDPIVDLKKVRSGDARGFTNAVMGFGYHIQAAVYRQLFDRERMVLLTVEDAPPFDVVPYELSPAFVRLGEREAQRLIARVRECEATGVWPGRSDFPIQLDPPEWAMSGMEVTIGGEAVFDDGEHPF